MHVNALQTYYFRFINKLILTFADIMNINLF